jgi:hypothetical protein
MIGLALNTLRWFVAVTTTWFIAQNFPENWGGDAYPASDRIIHLTHQAVENVEPCRNHEIRGLFDLGVPDRLQVTDQ